MTVVKVVEDIAFGAHWPCQSIGRGLCAKVQTGGSPRASREPLVASADEPSVGPEKDRHFSQCAYFVGAPARATPTGLRFVLGAASYWGPGARRPSTCTGHHLSLATGRSR